LGAGKNDPALLAVAGDEDRPVFAAFEDGFQAVQSQIRFRSLFAVAADARGFEQRLNVLGEGQTGLVGRRG
jgi:hypothetical protein